MNLVFEPGTAGFWIPEPEITKCYYLSLQLLFSAARMEPEPSEVVVPVRPKTTNVRMGRTRPTPDDDTSFDADDATTQRRESVTRPKTSQVRMSMSSRQSGADFETPGGMRPSWSSEPVTAKPRLSSLKNSRWGVWTMDLIYFRQPSKPLRWRSHQ